MSACTSDTQSLSATSAKSNLGREVSGLACNCGSCGICWSNIAIPPLNIKAKDLISIPQLVALALQADGWYLRQDNIWSKPNPMPESVTDRCTKAHEYVFLLTKQPKYFYDGEAIKEGRKSNEDANGFRGGIYVGGNTDNATLGKGRTVGNKIVCDKQRGHSRRHAGFNDRWDAMSKDEQASMGRNSRSVWTIPPEPFSGAHFATMPTELARRCIAAGSSERGQCPHCGAPWVRVIGKGEPDPEWQERCGADASGGYAGQSTKGHDDAGVQNASDVKRRILAGLGTKKFLGWRPSCACPPHEPVPQHVLDPFGGAGTTALVAERLKRDATIIELNPEYAAMARSRITGDSPLFAEVEHAAPQQG